MNVTTEPVPWITPALPDGDLLNAIGELVVRHVHLDHMLKMTIKSLLGITVDEALQQLSRKGAMQLRQQIEKEAQRRSVGGSDIAKLMQLLERCRDLSDRRNHFVKSVYVMHLSEPNVGKVALFDTVDQVNRPLPSVAAIRATAEEIAALIGEINHARLEGWLFEALEDPRKLDDE